MNNSQISLWNYLREFTRVYLLISINLTVLMVICLVFLDVLLPLQWIAYVVRLSIGANIGKSFYSKHKQHPNTKALVKLAVFCCLIAFIIDGVSAYLSLPNLDRMFESPFWALSILLVTQTSSFGLIWCGLKQGMRAAEKAEIDCIS
ncbi:ABZJ_00895 family protein [Pseudovibrio ascidiaceicola]|uniref:ABZJ_00895 family protein n=1 Tax=Pseudovibrio ascidiaceicola TaxID=285279 RepID=UPI000D68D5C9|nr:ABZJ_00895 family protein [Pseudovibrio ascidiaceicola]